MTLTISENQWNKISNIIRAEYGDSILLISWKLREVLGFTVRRHRDYSPINGHMINDIRLDFYNEPAMTFFQLKYLNTDA
jgi:hypothetical protein